MQKYNFDYTRKESQRKSLHLKILTKYIECHKFKLNSMTPKKLHIDEYMITH